jgi:hypothetical protein
MVDLPKLDFIGFASVLAGIVFLLTGLLFVVNTGSTIHDPVNPTLMSLIGIVTAIIGLMLVLARND